MGFEVPRKTAQLQFEGDEFDGCEIEVALDLTFEAQEHMDALRRAEDEEKNHQAVEFFVKNCILSWNLEDKDGNALPISGASFFQFPSWFGVLILNTYTAAVRKLSEVPAPLAEPLPNGDTSTEAPTAAPESLPTPA